MRLAASGTPENSAVAGCSVVPITVRLARKPEGGRPTFEVSQIGGELRRSF